MVHVWKKIPPYSTISLNKMQLKKNMGVGNLFKDTFINKKKHFNPSSIVKYNNYYLRYRLTRQWSKPFEHSFIKQINSQHCTTIDNKEVLKIPLYFNIIINMSERIFHFSQQSRFIRTDDHRHKTSETIYSFKFLSRV